MSKTGLRAVVLVAVIALLGVASYAVAGGSKHKLKEVTLEGYQENPDVSTSAIGSFEAIVAPDDQSLTYTVDYSGLEGTVTQSHIHFGKLAVNGGISIWLCGTAALPGPAGTPVCPASGSVTRTVTAAEVVGPAAQGIDTLQFAEIIAAIRAGRAYANVHSSRFPGGEIRAQINDREGEKDD